ncbi:putative Protein-tyrosine-phosphatase [uncultured Paludibacter sp.]|uniref:Phosphotyrosine protein phosphatase I domain-containing protein n=1 Tax=uncultured Paludibacter sp. TaxID=497635 RepID=A0A653AF94_9BACT|nr:putative Protein-tyrosine-phosphatase [uncultured Paludibacter sp.]
MKSILFVCLGNICRSPMAETIFNKVVKENGKSVQFQVDSAGLLDYHEGEEADFRMRAHAKTRGYNITHRSRPVIHKDLEEFDYIIGMDEQNIHQLNRMAKTSEIQLKIHKMTDFGKNMQAESVPDPYYEGDKSFEYVIDLLEDACQGLFEYLNK